MWFPPLTSPRSFPSHPPNSTPFPLSLEIKQSKNWNIKEREEIYHQIRIKRNRERKYETKISVTIYKQTANKTKKPSLKKDINLKDSRKTYMEVFVWREGREGELL